MQIETASRRLRAFHGEPALKIDRIARVDAHIAADELVRGATGDDGKGCAVWCTLDAYDHSRYPIELGIPEWLARVEDVLFEGMSVKKSKTWPRDFLMACGVGMDLDRVKAPFMVVVLKSTLTNFDHAKFPQVVAAVQGSIVLWERDDIGSEDWGSAGSAARSAGSAAGSAAWSAAESAESAAWSAAWSAESAAWSAAESAVWSAGSAGSAARSAAESAVWSAGSARSAARSAGSAGSAARSAAESAARSAAESAAESAAYDGFADALLTIIGGIPAA